MRENAPVVVLVLWPHLEPTFPEELRYLRSLADDLEVRGIKLIPLPLFPPFPPYPPELWFDEFEHMLRGERNWFREWDYWIHRWENYWPEREHLWRHWHRYFPELIERLAYLSDKEELSGIIVVTHTGAKGHIDEDDVMFSSLIAEIPDRMLLFQLNLGSIDHEAKPIIPHVQSFNYPEDRSKVIELITYRARVLREERYPADMAPQPMPEQRAPSDAKPRVSLPEEAAVDEVHLGVAAPNNVCLGDEFVARFAAYTDNHRSEVQSAIAQEAPTANARLDLETCRWRPGTRVTVRLNVHNMEVTNSAQSFRWNGAWHILRFDIKVPFDIGINNIILKFDIAVEGLPIISLRPEIAVDKQKSNKAASLNVIEKTAPNTAFASYAKKDRRDVLGRVRSLQIFTGIDVFLDCLSVNPGEQWKLSLKNEIQDRDIFWLFWSRNAMASEWVEWEWRTALNKKSITGIQPHPLEPAELAPPPKELSSLQFGSLYEWYISQLRESPIVLALRILLHRGLSLKNRVRRKSR